MRSRVAKKNKRASNAFSHAARKSYFIQPKLEIGQPGDEYEQEADAVAGKVMRMPEQNFVQRKCAECEKEEKEKLQRKPLSDSITPFIQTKSEVTNHVSDSLSQSIQSSKGGGNAMDSHTESFMSSRFGKDFSDVKIHTDNEAVQTNRNLNAKAFTVGNDIYFNEGQYQPNSSEGKQLLAHELTHVVQQDAFGGISDKVFKQGQEVPLPSLTDVKSRILVAYDNIFDKQTEAIKWFEDDMEHPDEPTFIESILKAAIELAIGKAIGAIGSIISTGIENILIKNILKEEVIGFDLKSAEQIEFLKNYIATEDKVKGAAISLSSSLISLAADKAKSFVAPALSKLGNKLPPSKKFIETQRKTLSDSKNELQNIFTFSIAPQLNALPPQDALVISLKIFKAMQNAFAEASEIQYLNTVAQWANLVGREEDSYDDTSIQIGGQMKGTLFITYEGEPSNIVISDARFRGIDSDILNRISSTPSLASMTLRNLDCTKVFFGPTIFVKYSGQGLKYEDVRSGLSGSEDFGRVIYLWMALEDKKFSDIAYFSNKRKASFFGKDVLIDT